MEAADIWRILSESPGSFETIELDHSKGVQSINALSIDQRDLTDEEFADVMEQLKYVFDEATPDRRQLAQELLEKLSQMDGPPNRKLALQSFLETYL